MSRPGRRGAGADFITQLKRSSSSKIDESFVSGIFHFICSDHAQPRSLKPQKAKLQVRGCGCVGSSWFCRSGGLPTMDTTCLTETFLRALVFAWYFSFLSFPGGGDSSFQEQFQALRRLSASAGLDGSSSAPAAPSVETPPQDLQALPRQMAAPHPWFCCAWFQPSVITAAETIKHVRSKEIMTFELCAVLSDVTESPRPTPSHPGRESPSVHSVHGLQTLPACWSLNVLLSYHIHCLCISALCSSRPDFTRRPQSTTVGVPKCRRRAVKGFPWVRGECRTTRRFERETAVTGFFTVHCCHRFIILLWLSFLTVPHLQIKLCHGYARIGKTQLVSSSVPSAVSGIHWGAGNVSPVDKGVTAIRTQFILANRPSKTYLGESCL